MAGATGVDWRGYWPAAPTPFERDGAVDFAAWQRLMDCYVKEGVHGVLVNGSTGEWFSQSRRERSMLADSAVEAIQGRIPVIIGVSAFTAAEAIELGRAAERGGADGILATPPPYVHPTSDEIERFYIDVSMGCSLPLMVYNWPRGIGLDMSVELLTRLSRLEGVVAIKESSGDELKCVRVLEQVGDTVRFFARFIHRRGLAVIREIGGHGNIDGGGLGARFGVGFYTSLWAGDLDTARRHSRDYETLTTSLMEPDYSARFGSPIPQLKAAMRMLGQDGGYVRPPLLELTDSGVLDDLRSALVRGGLLPVEDCKGADK